MNLFSSALHCPEDAEVVDTDKTAQCNTRITGIIGYLGQLGGEVLLNDA
jgi:hypothetical protein